MLKIAICGRMRAGKDTVADYLVKHYKFIKFAFADELKEHYHALFGNTEKKPRKAYQWFGDVTRQHDPDVWIRHCLNSPSFGVTQRIDWNIVISDLRLPNEHQRLLDEGYTIIRVNAPLDLRLKRMEGDTYTEAELNHHSETHSDTFKVHYDLYNGGTFEDLYKRIDNIMKKLVPNEDCQVCGATVFPGADYCSSCADAIIQGVMNERGETIV